ncbi:class F sortase [Demequina sp. NBRC 110057]|uniref:class F sortase n=1 Tax=Demequina sp. NBRC 110057 TaxID=1570346 RepID=UPI000A02207B|nr:class F sortase [Demequina sp. NBRC 110057]
MNSRLAITAGTALLVGAGALGYLAYDALRVEAPPPLAAATATTEPQAPPDRNPSVTAPTPAPTSVGAGTTGRDRVTVADPAPALPTRLEIPAIDVDTVLERLGLLTDGSLATPEDTDLAGWFEGGPRPGAIGPSVIAGHVSWNGDPSVFFRLTELVPGDLITVEQADGREVTFEVTRIEQHPKDAFPTVEVYSNTDDPELRLITCGGDFDSSTGHFDDNIVVFARLADA